MKKAKKATPKKKIVIKKKQAIVPLKYFKGHVIRRRKASVEFGCGAVRVQKDDLRTLITLTEKEKQSLRSIPQIMYETFSLARLSNNPDLQKSLISILNNPHRQLAMRLTAAGRNYITLNEILKIPSITLLGIIGN